MQRALLIVGIISLVIVSCSSDGPTDGRPSITLTWTATGDDSGLGRAQEYDLRMSRDSTDIADDFESNTRLSGLPAPREAGQAETFTVTDLSDNTTYYFALRTVDESGNWSEQSNVAVKRASYPNTAASN